MILVVAGHYRHSLEPSYWIDFYTIRHQFTMPLFFILSGFLFRYISASDTDNYYKVFFTKKLHRLVYPYLVISLLYFIVKFFAGFVFDLQHPADLESLLFIILDPLRGSSTLLWFMYTLILVFILYPALKKIFRNDLLVFAISVGMMFVPLTGYFCLNPLVAHLPFFIFGTLLAGRVDFDELSIRRNLLVIAAGTCVFAAVFYFRHLLDLKIARLIMGIVGTLAVISISSLLVRSGRNFARNFLESAGYYSMSIYLFHILLLGTFRVAKYQVFHIEGYFFAGAITAIATATIVPLIAEKRFLRNIKFIRKYVLGLK